MKPKDIKELRKLTKFLRGETSLDNEFAAVDEIVRKVSELKKEGKIDIKDLKSQEIIQLIKNLGQQDLSKLIFLLILDKI